MLADYHDVKESLVFLWYLSLRVKYSSSHLCLKGLLRLSSRQSPLGILWPLSFPVFSGSQAHCLLYAISPAPPRLWACILSFHLSRQFLFVVAFTTFLVSCVDYDILFANKMVNHSLHPTEPVKVTLPDAFLPAQVCSSR